MKGLNIITPVKDSIELSGQTIRAVMASQLTMPFHYTVYNDNSTQENTERLKQLSAELGFRLVNISEIIDHPSPNYLWVLQRAQQESVEEDYGLLIVESDVVVKEDTLQSLYERALSEGTCGMAAAVTVDADEKINYPYESARKYPVGKVREKGHLSFCCSLLKPEFLKVYDFHQLNPQKYWFDVTISHQSLKKGFVNFLYTDLTVWHRPHSSRPWKLMKYQHPLKYYWRKFTKGLDRI